MSIKVEKVDISDQRLPIKTYIGDTVTRGALHCGLHIHDEIEIVYMMEGSMEFVVEAQRVVLQPGDILLINSLVAHRSNTLTSYAKMCFLQFDFDKIVLDNMPINRYLINFKNQSNFKYFNIHPDEYESYQQMIGTLVEIANEFEKKQMAYDVDILCEISRFFILLCRCGLIKADSVVISGDSTAAQRITDVLIYVEKNYAKPITVRDAAELVSLNYCYFCRLFKQSTGRTFVEYLNYYRISVAKRKLVQENTSVTEIMFDTGFASISYFNRIFKKYTSFSPTEYRTKFHENAEK